MVRRPHRARPARHSGRLPASPGFRGPGHDVPTQALAAWRRRVRALFLAGLVLTAGLVVLVSVLPVAQAQSGQIGVSPAKLGFDDPPLVRGGSKEAILHFQQRFDSAAEVTIEVLPPPDRDDGTTLRDASAWVTADPVGTFRLEPTDDYPVRVVVSVPDQAANGDYGAAVRFKVTPEDDGSSEDGAGAAVATSVTALLEISVGGEQVNRVESRGTPQVRDAEQDGMWTFDVPLANTGNVDSNPHVRVQVWDKMQKEIVRTYWFNDTVIRAGVSGLYTFSVDMLDLDQDQYWAKVAVFNDARLVAESDFQTFDVVEPGALKRLAVLRTIRIGDGTSAYADAGDLLALTAVVRNDGELPLVGVFKAKVILDGKLVDAFDSDPAEVAVGDEGEIEHLYRVDTPGRYEFQGRVHYGPKVTEEKSAIVTVRDAPGGLGPLLLVGGALALLVVVGAGIALARKGRGDKAAGPAGARDARRRAPRRHPAKPGAPTQRPAQGRGRRPSDPRRRPPMR